MLYPPTFAPVYLPAANNPKYPMIGAPPSTPPPQPAKTTYAGNEVAVNAAWSAINSSMGRTDPRFVPHYPFLNNNLGVIATPPKVPGTGAIPFMVVNPTIASNWGTNGPS